MLLYINMKNYKGIVWADFLNVNIVLNLYSYKQTRVLY